MTDIPVRSVTHEQLLDAFYPWITNQYPQAKCIGDVVLAIAHTQETNIETNLGVDNA